MPKPIKLKLDVTKIDKAHLYRGAKGTYLDAVAWPRKDGPDEYGNSHFIVQDLPRAARDAGAKGAIIGNMTLDGSAPATQTADNRDDIPF